jgi:hypothetical protein
MEREAWRNREHFDSFDGSYKKYSARLTTQNINMI